MEQNSEEQPIKNQVYSREEYAKASFWDDRYAEKGGFFDWYAEYPELKPVFNEYGITPSDRVLMVGCGNSKLSQQMWEAGYKDIVNIDISPSVI
jgi:2-polyprenyl-3-methyl-5-hydroxy-6-metoxy-1,4-benzoquinol methylase